MRLAYYLAQYDAAYTHYTMPPPGPMISGGPSTAVRGLTQALARQGHDITILAQGPETVAFDDGPVKVRIHKRPIIRLPFLVSRALLRDVTNMASAYDAIVLNGIFQPDLLAVSLAARRARLPYVVSPHDPYHPAIFALNGRRKRLYWFAIERAILQHSVAVQVLSSIHEDHLRNHGIDRPVIAVPNGYDLDPAQSVTPPHPAQQPVTLGYLGRLDAWHKGIDLLLEGFAMARGSHHDLRLVLQGPDWGDRPMLEALARRLGVSDVVDFREPDPAPAAEIIAGWDALVAPSRFDGFPLTVLEAMAAGRPVICSKEAGVVEHVVASGCGIAMSASAHGVAQAILQLLASRDQWAALGMAGHRYLIAHLNWDAIAGRAAESYRAILPWRPVSEDMTRRSGGSPVSLHAVPKVRI